VEHASIEDLAITVTQVLDKSRVVLIYAPNSTGKTRLTQRLKERDPGGVVLYNALVEDYFSWDNEQYVLTMSPDSDLLGTIATQGLDSAIVGYFRHFTGERIEPLLDVRTGEITFGIHTGDESSADGIKISRAEESLFVWCVYYSVLNEVVDVLCESPELRSTSQYDAVRYAVIDDPVSSMDDERIVALALAIEELVRRASETELRFVITTHHALFFNVLFNALRAGRDKRYVAYLLGKVSTSGWTLKRQQQDSPFSYHLEVIREIETAISDGAVRRVHFNQFRTLLEKTATFLGYSGGWGQLLSGADGAVLTRALNLYSHDRLADLDYAELPADYIDAFSAQFRSFMKAFGWAEQRHGQ
jgi:hypothetical protein